MRELRIHGIGSPFGRQSRHQQVRGVLALAGEILVEIVLVGSHRRPREDDEKADRPARARLAGPNGMIQPAWL